MTRRHSKLKINIKEGRDASNDFTPQTVQAHFSASNLMQSQNFNNQQPDQRHNLIERMSRIESIISHGKSYERVKDENINPLTTKNEYNYNYTKDYSPLYYDRNVVSPAPSNRINA